MLPWPWSWQHHLITNRRRRYQCKPNGEDAKLLDVAHVSYFHGNRRLWSALLIVVMTIVTRQHWLLDCDFRQSLKCQVLYSDSILGVIQGGMFSSIHLVVQHVLHLLPVVYCSCLCFRLVISLVIL